MRMAVGRFRPSTLLIIDGQPRPTGATNADAAAEWTQNNNAFFTILFFMTKGSAHTTVKDHMSTNAGEMGDGAAAWKALKARFDGNTKQAGRAAREELYMIHMEENACPVEAARCAVGQRFLCNLAQRLGEPLTTIPEVALEFTNALLEA